MQTEQVYYVLANPPTTPEPERRSGNRKLLVLAVIGVGAYLLYQNDKKIREQAEEARLKKQTADAYATFPK